MWFALGTPVVLMVGAVLMERVEHYCAEVPARSRVAEPVAGRQAAGRRLPADRLVVLGNAALRN